MAKIFKSHTGLTVLSRAMGRVQVSLVCPFCGLTVYAHLWSLAGSGKKCECGALCGQTGAWK